MSDCTAIATEVARQPAAEILTPGDTVRVVARQSAFRQERRILDLPAGLSVQEIVERAYPKPPSGLVASLYGERIARERWAKVRLKAGTELVLQPVPANFRNLLSILVVVAAAAATWYVGGAGGLLAGMGVGAGWAAAGGALAGALVGIAGSFLLNALFPVRPPQLETTDSGQVYSITASNQANLFGPIPSVLGTMRVYPAYGAQPYTEILGPDQYLRCLYIVGIGPLDINEIKLGETPIGSFQDVELEIGHGYPGEPGPTLYPGQVFQQDLSVDLVFANGWNVRTTAANIDEISVDFVAPSGILAIAENGKRHEHSIGIDIQYRLVGAPDWTPWISAYRWAGKTEKMLRLGFRLSVPRGQYEVRVRRAWEEWAGRNENGVTLEQGIWTALRGFRNENPIRFKLPLAWIAIRIRASDQLNGAITDLNCIATTRARKWDGSTWLENQPTNHPADLFRLVAQGPANARAYDDAHLHLESIQEWHTYCSLNGFTFNQVRDFRASVLETLADIAAAGRASVSMIDGKLGVIWDRPGDPIVQHFTPRNSWSFSSTRAYKEWPHAWRVRFINEQQGYLQDERLVFDDGYNEENATRFEGIEFPGVTNPDLIWRHGRFQIAQARLRPEYYSLSVDFEHLICTRGDRVRVTHDVPGFGLKSARVRAVNAGLPQSVTLDEVITQVSGGTYAIRFRLDDGTSILRSVTTTEGESNVVRLTGSGALPEPGDLAMFGEASSESVVLRVHSIQPQDNLSARLTLVDDAPEISQADQGAIPPFDSNITIPPDPWQLPPTDLRVREYVYLGQNGAPREAAEVAWSVPRRGVITGFEVQYSTLGADGPWQPGGTVSWPATSLNVTDLDEGSYWFRVRCLFTGNRASSWLTGGPYSLVELLTPPPDVTNFRIAVLGTTATLSWDRVDTPAMSHYAIRYSPATVGATWGSAVPLLDRIDATSVQIPAQAGTYLIKAVEIGGLESVNATGIATNVTLLAGINVVETVHEDPYWAGTMDGVEYDAHFGGIRLAQYSGGSDSEGEFDAVLFDGYYYFSNAVDLQDVFTSRLSARMLAYGLAPGDDFFEPADFFEVDDFFRFDPAQWFVSLEIRYTTDDPAASDAVWSDWETFTQSDYTARAFEFRLYLATRESGLTPLVQSLSVTVDMPDRIEADRDITVPVTGLRVTFDPPFLGLAGVATSAQDLATGERPIVTNKDVTGFDVIILDAANNPVERTIDWLAKGFGRRINP